MGLTPQDKSDERRKLGVLPSKFNKRATDEALLSLSSFVGSSANSESTMALGIFETESEKVIMIALQEGAEVNEDILKQGNRIWNWLDCDPRLPGSAAVDSTPRCRDHTEGVRLWKNLPHAGKVCRIHEPAMPRCMSSTSC